MKKLLTKAGWWLGVSPIIFGFVSLREGIAEVVTSRDYWNERGVLIDRSPQPDKALGWIQILAGSVQLFGGLIWFTILVSITIYLIL